VETATPIADRRPPAWQRCVAVARSASSRTGGASLLSLPLFSENLRSGASSPREIGRDQRTMTFAHSAGDFNEGLRSLA
jgi:hypothetical protein